MKKLYLVLSIIAAVLILSAIGTLLRPAANPVTQAIPAATQTVPIVPTAPASTTPVQPTQGTQTSQTTSTQPTQQADVQVYFPRAGDQVPERLVSLYNGATISLDIAIYSLTYPSIVKAIGDAARRGVKVRIITDSIEAKDKSQQAAINDLLTIGIPVKINTHSGLMHLKMSIIDGSTVTTGSYNYTAEATNENDEMFVIVTDPAFVTKCSMEFSQLWAGTGFVDAK
ncbi:MAG: phospholipase D-like domain-containing protein [Dehalococcoidia bacterium]